MSKRDREDELCDILEICNVKKKNKLDNEGIERLFNVCRNNNSDELKLILKSSIISPSIQNSNGQTPLMFAVIHNSQNVAVMLINCKISEPNIKDNYGHTALYYASLNNNYNLVKLILKFTKLEDDTQIILENKEIIELFDVYKSGKLRSKILQPREKKMDRQSLYRKELIDMYGGCIITGIKAHDCDHLHISSAKQHGLDGYSIYNGILLSKNLYRNYYKNGELKFDKSEITPIDENYVNIKLKTNNLKIIYLNSKIVKIHKESIKFIV
jgi:hypothetical protein